MPGKPADLFDTECPSRDVLELVGSKWSMLLLCTMKNGPVRTGELRRAVTGISQKMLTQTLRDLERNGIIDRIDHAQVPPRVEYSLTEVGHSLSRLMKQMEHWIVEHYDYIVASQGRYKPHCDKTEAEDASENQHLNHSAKATALRH